MLKSLEKKNPPRSRNKADIEFYSCHENGHYARECPLKNPESVYLPLCILETRTGFLVDTGAEVIIMSLRLLRKSLIVPIFSTNVWFPPMIS